MVEEEELCNDEEVAAGAGGSSRGRLGILSPVV